MNHKAPIPGEPITLSGIVVAVTEGKVANGRVADSGQFVTVFVSSADQILADGEAESLYDLSPAKRSRTW